MVFEHPVENVVQAYIKAKSLITRAKVLDIVNAEIGVGLDARLVRKCIE